MMGLANNIFCDSLPGLLPKDMDNEKRSVSFSAKASPEFGKRNAKSC